MKRHVGTFINARLKDRNLRSRNKLDDLSKIEVPEMKKQKQDWSDKK